MVCVTELRVVLRKCLVSFEKVITLRRLGEDTRTLASELRSSSNFVDLCCSVADGVVTARGQPYPLTHHHVGLSTSAVQGWLTRMNKKE